MKPFRIFSRLPLLVLLLAAGFRTAAPEPVRAESRNIRGCVRDRQGTPLAGVAVIGLPENTHYAVTGDDGCFVLEIPDKAQRLTALRIHLIGYLSREIAVSDSTRSAGTIVLEEDLMNLETAVVTGTRTPKLLKNSPVLTRIISTKDIERSDALHIGDLLQSELPGIEFSYAMNQQVTLNMQGFGGNSVLFLVDGERLAGETLDNIDYNRLNLDDVARVEIIKGAASSLYGSNAVGGVVNLITKRAEDPWSVRLDARRGAHNEQRYGAGIGLSGKRLNSLTSVQYHSIDSYRMKNEGDYNTFYGGFDYQIKERLEYAPTERLRLTGRAGYYFRERFSSSETHDRYRDFSGGVKAEYKTGSDGNAELYYGFDQYDKSDLLVFNGTDIRDYSNVQHTLRGLYTRRIGNRHTVTAGGDWMRDYLMSYQFDGKGYYIQHTADAFAQFDCSLSDRWNLIAGLRYDFFSRKRLNHLSPKLSLMYRFGGWAFRGSYAGGFRAPTLKEMYMSFDMAGIFMIYGNPDLAPESSQNLSLSAEYTWKYFNASVTGFRNYVENRITTVWNEALNGMRYSNMSPLRIAGAEAVLSARLPCGFGGRLAYTFTHEAIRKGEPLISQTRPHAATVRLEYGRQWKNYGFDLSLGGRILSEVTTEVYTSATDYEETESVTYPGYTLWKLTLSQRFWRGISLNLIIDNLFNYIPDYYYNSTPSTVGTTAAVGLTLRLEEMFNRH